MRSTTARAVLLDVDGTLLDSNEQHALAWVDALRAQGIPRSLDQVRPLIGMGGDKLIPQLTGLDPESSAGKQLSQRRSQRFMQHYVRLVRPFPEVRALLKRLVDARYDLCVATSAKRDELEALLEQGGILDLLPLRTSADDAEHSKPDADIVVAALRKVGAAPHRALMLGDTPYDAAAAAKAGVSFVGLLCGGHVPASFEKAVAVYRDPADLLTNFASSPLASAEAV